MLNSLDLVLRSSDDSFGIRSEEILWTLVIQKAVEPRKPECESPTVLSVTKDAQDIRYCLVGAIGFMRIERVYGKVVSPLVMDREDRSIPLPLVRLSTGIIRAVPSKLRDLACREEVATIQDGRLRVDHHARLRKSCIRDRNLRKQSANDLVDCLVLTLPHELGIKFGHPTNHQFEQMHLVIVRKSDCQSPAGRRAMQKLDHLWASSHHDRGNLLVELFGVGHVSPQTGVPSPYNEYYHDFSIITIISTRLLSGRFV